MTEGHICKKACISQIKENPAQAEGQHHHQKVDHESERWFTLHFFYPVHFYKLFETVKLMILHVKCKKRLYSIKKGPYPFD